MRELTSIEEVRADAVIDGRANGDDAVVEVLDALRALGRRSPAPSPSAAVSSFFDGHRRPRAVGLPAVAPRQAWTAQRLGAVAAAVVLVAVGLSLVLRPSSDGQSLDRTATAPVGRAPSAVSEAVPDAVIEPAVTVPVGPGAAVVVPQPPNASRPPAALRPEGSSAATATLTERPATAAIVPTVPAAAPVTGVVTAPRAVSPAGAAPCIGDPPCSPLQSGVTSESFVLGPSRASCMGDPPCVPAFIAVTPTEPLVSDNVECIGDPPCIAEDTIFTIAGTPAS